MTTSSQQNIESFLRENQIPHDEQHLKNWSTPLYLINHWSKCESEIPYADGVHEPQARANFDLVKAKAHNLGVTEVKKYTFSQVYEEGQGMDLVRDLYDAFVVQGKTVSPLKRQSYEERRGRFGPHLDWKKELQMQLSSSDDENAMEERSAEKDKAAEQTSAQSTSYLGRFASVTALLAALAAVLGAVFFRRQAAAAE